MRRLAFLIALGLGGCDADEAAPAADAADLGVPGDAGEPDDGAAMSWDAAPRVVPDGGDGFTPPPSSDPPVVHAPPAPLTVAGTLLPGLEVLDVSVDQGGGVWAVTRETVYYFPPGRSTPYTYDQKDGLARGWSTYEDKWFDPGTHPVTFASVAGATPGAAVIGNIGALADRLVVDPSSGAVRALENLKVPDRSDPDYIYERQIRVISAVEVVVDLNGTYEGTAYLGGFHGFYALHGLTGDCRCLAFEEHQHYVDDVVLAGSDVHGLALTADGDLWAGDRDLVTLLPQRSKGPRTGLFDHDFVAAIDVFPGRRDEVFDLAVDGAGGVWVASYGNGLAYLAPVTHAARYFSAADTLPQNRIRALALDGSGAVWIGAATAGLARFQPQAGTWTYHTTASGLPADGIYALHYDALSGSGRLYVATASGVAIVQP